MVKLQVLDKKTRKVLSEHTNKEFIYQSLSMMLIARYQYHSEMIKSVRNHNLYTGYRKIVFYLDNNCIYEYTVEE